MKGVTEDYRWCNKCGRRTKWSVSAGRLGRCMEHEVSYRTKKQIEALERRKKEKQQPRLF
jgi:hypothetical protein